MPKKNRPVRREVRWERMFRDELEQAFAECPLVYFSYGLCEPHGPHNALGLDTLKAHALACRAARAHGGIVAPPDYWHIHELGLYGAWADKKIGHVERTWLTAVPPWVHFKNVCYHIRAADAQGFKAAILLTGHYGPNWRDLKTLVRLIQPHIRTRLYGLPDFEANRPGFDRDGRSGGDHAGRVETSLLWALEPECVDASRLPRQQGHHFAMGPDAPEATRQIGERMVEDEVRWLGRKAQELLRGYRPRRRRDGVMTFEDVEIFWNKTVRPRLKDFHSMQGGGAGEKNVPPAKSSWRRNWPVMANPP